MITITSIFLHDPLQCDSQKFNKTEFVNSALHTLKKDPGINVWL